MEVLNAVDALTALAHDSRIAIFRYLLRVGDGGAIVSEIRHELAIPAATLSFHLSTLKQAGLLRCHREGRQLHYRADYDCLGQLLRYLTEDCCGGKPETCAEMLKAAGQSA